MPECPKLCDWADRNDGSDYCGLGDALREQLESQRDMEKELGRAYRAIHGLYNARSAKNPPNEDDAMVAYHSPTIAAAARFVWEGEMEYSDYFFGKPIEVMQQYLSIGCRPENANKENGHV